MTVGAGDLGVGREPVEAPPLGSAGAPRPRRRRRLPEPIRLLLANAPQSEIAAFVQKHRDALFGITDDRVRQVWLNGFCDELTLLSNSRRLWPSLASHRGYRFVRKLRGQRTPEAHPVIVTAPGIDSDIVVRVFAPKVGLPEDPVCGTAHRISG